MLTEYFQMPYCYIRIDNFQEDSQTFGIKIRTGNDLLWFYLSMTGYNVVSHWAILIWINQYWCISILHWIELYLVSGDSQDAAVFSLITFAWSHMLISRCHLWSWKINKFFWKSSWYEWISNLSLSPFNSAPSASVQLLQKQPLMDF